MSEKLHFSQATETLNKKPNTTEEIMLLLEKHKSFLPENSLHKEDIPKRKEQLKNTPTPSIEQIKHAISLVFDTQDNHLSYAQQIKEGKKLMQQTRIIYEKIILLSDPNDHISSKIEQLSEIEMTLLKKMTLVEQMEIQERLTNPNLGNEEKNNLEQNIEFTKNAIQLIDKLHTELEQKKKQLKK